jgi:uncharacterized membrane protein YtjA (UPF0391 family)
MWIMLAQYTTSAADTGQLAQVVSSALSGKRGGAKGVEQMLKWALIFFVVALIAAFLGFGGIAGAAAGIAKFLFVAFLVVAAVVLIMGLLGAKKVL